MKEGKKPVQLPADYQRDLNDIRVVLRLAEGQRFFKRIFRQVEGISMTGTSWTYFNEGMRNFAKSLWDDAVVASPVEASRICIAVYNEKREGE